QTVRAGKQTTDEMFNGYFEWALADEDLTRPRFPTVAVCWGLAAALGLGVVYQRLRSTRQLRHKGAG
ncbi:MAG TPA: hypothetical protein VKD72_35870, partial [Gemmataceae bacterium]|nr:hypothetical protein [Gemmataceae bacterium]